MRPISRRVIIIAAGATLAVLLTWYLLLWSPRKGALADARQRSATARSTRDALRLQLAQLQDLQERSALTQSRLEELRSAVPDLPNLAQFILDADAAARRAGIDFLSIAPTPPAPLAEVAGVFAIAIQISATGEYFQVLDWLNRLNDIGRIVVIDTLNLSGGEDALSVSVSARIFTANLTTTALTPTATGA